MFWNPPGFIASGGEGGDPGEGGIMTGDIAESGGFSGNTSTAEVTNAVGVGAILKNTGSGAYVLASAASDAGVPAVALALEAGSGEGKNILLKGFVRLDTWNWSPGLLFLSPTNGLMTQTAPSTVGQIVQVLGVVHKPTVIFFNPEITLLEI